MQYIPGYDIMTLDSALVARFCEDPDRIRSTVLGDGYLWDMFSKHAILSYLLANPHLFPAFVADVMPDGPGSLQFYVPSDDSFLDVFDINNVGPFMH